jgi:opacity protein-like surface antigen
MGKCQVEVNRVRTSSLGAGLAPLGTSNAFVLTAGGGLDWKLNSTIGIRVFQAEYLYTQFQNEKNDTQNNFRFSAGIVLSFGKR